MVSVSWFSLGGVLGSRSLDPGVFVQSCSQAKLFFNFNTSLLRAGTAPPLLIV